MNTPRSLVILLVMMLFLVVGALSERRHKSTTRELQRLNNDLDAATSELAKTQAQLNRLASNQNAFADVVTRLERKPENSKDSHRGGTGTSHLTPTSPLPGGGLGDIPPPSASPTAQQVGCLRNGGGMKE